MGVTSVQGEKFQIPKYLRGKFTLHIFRRMRTATSVQGEKFQIPKYLRGKVALCNISEDAYCYLSTRRNFPNSKVFAWENCIAYILEDAYCYLGTRRKIPNSKVFAWESCIAYFGGCVLLPQYKEKNSKFQSICVGKLHCIYFGECDYCYLGTRRKIPNSKVFGWESCIAHILEDANIATLVQGEKFQIRTYLRGKFALRKFPRMHIATSVITRRKIPKYLRGKVALRIFQRMRIAASALDIT